MRRQILVFNLLLGALCSAWTPVSALESFNFAGSHVLELEEPACMASLGDGRWAFYDEKEYTLHVLNPDFSSSRAINLREELDARPKISVLDFRTHSGQLLALDASSRFVYVFNDRGDYQRTIDLNVSKPARIRTASCMAVDATGRLYVGDAGGGDIKVFSLSGLFLMTLTLPPDAEGRIAGMSPGAMTVLADGALLVVEEEAQAAMIFERTGEFREAITLGGDFDSITRIMAIQDGGLLGFDGDDCKIYRWSADGELRGVLGAKGKGRGRFGKLADLGCDVKGNLVALDTKYASVQVIAFETGTYTLSGKALQPAFAVEHTGDVESEAVIIQLLDDGFVTFDKKAKVVGVVRSEGALEYQHEDIRDVSTVYLSDKLAYLYDRYRKTVYAFDLKSGAFQFEFGGRGRGEGSLGEVVRILHGTDDKLYLADTTGTRIQIFSSDGIFSTQFGEKGTTEAGMIGKISDMAWSGKDLAVLDSTREKVHVFSVSGEHLRELDLPVSASASELVALEVDRNGFILTLDVRNFRVYVMDEGGVPLFAFGSSGKRELDWNSPSMIHMGRDGVFQVYEENRPGLIRSYRFRSPGPLNRIEQSIDAQDWLTASTLLEPYLTASSDEAKNALPGYEEAMLLALTVDVESSKPILDKTQRSAVQQVASRRLESRPGDVSARLALVQSLRTDGSTREAIVMLRKGRAIAEDSRMAALETELLKDLETKSLARAIISIKAVEMPVVFPAMSQRYFDEPMVKVTLQNGGGAPSKAGRVLFYAKGVMDAPTETDLPPVEPFTTVTVPVKIAFARNVLTYVEASRISADVSVELGADQDAAARRNVTFQLAGRNSIDWGQEEMISCFITPKDPDVQFFARQALKMADAATIDSDIDEHLSKALIMFDAIQSVGVYYLPDPRQPFSFSKVAGGGVVDYLQYPRETLQRQSGDCDDLSVLYCALLEGAGIPTVMITSPGHIFAAFELKEGEEAVKRLGLSEDLLIKHDGRYYVPVETTLVGSPFISAWRVAANTIAKYQPTKEIGIISVKEAWRTYRTVSLPPQQREVRTPEKDVLATMLKRELDALNLKQVEKRLAIFKKWLATEPRNIALHLQLARSYGEVGLFDVAERYASKAVGLDPGNPRILQVLGNLSYMQNQYTEAAGWYVKADKASPDAGTKISLAMTYLKAGELLKARDNYRKAKELNSDIGHDYPELRQLLE